jgi:mediator of RNA polymerase II transcription subunit 10
VIIVESLTAPEIYSLSVTNLILNFIFQVKGKIDAYRMFKAKLLLELSSVFPKEINHYRALRGDERNNP